MCGKGYGQKLTMSRVVAGKQVWPMGYVNGKREKVQG